MRWYLYPVVVPRDPAWRGAQGDIRRLKGNLQRIKSANRHRPTLVVQKDGSLLLTIAVPGKGPGDAARTAERLAAQQARGARISGMQPRAQHFTKSWPRDPLITG
jgi:hypothetical protein